MNYIFPPPTLFQILPTSSHFITFLFLKIKNKKVPPTHKSKAKQKKKAEFLCIGWLLLNSPLALGCGWYAQHQLLLKEADFPSS